MICFHRPATVQQDLPSATGRIAALLLPALLYLSVVVMHDPLWAQWGARHAKLQYQTTGGTVGCHESFSTHTHTAATGCLRCTRPPSALERKWSHIYVQRVKLISHPLVKLACGFQNKLDRTFILNNSLHGSLEIYKMGCFTCEVLFSNISYA